MDALLFTKYECLLRLRQELRQKEAEINAYLVCDQADWSDIVELALVIQQMTLLLKEFVLDLLSSPPETLGMFDQRIFELTVAEMFCHYGIGHQG